MPHLMIAQLPPEGLIKIVRNDLAPQPRVGRLPDIHPLTSLPLHALANFLRIIP